MDHLVYINRPSGSSFSSGKHNSQTSTPLGNRPSSEQRAKRQSDNNLIAKPSSRLSPIKVRKTRSNLLGNQSGYGSGAVGSCRNDWESSATSLTLASPRSSLIKTPTSNGKENSPSKSKVPRISSPFPISLLNSRHPQIIASQSSYSDRDHCSAESRPSTSALSTPVIQSLPSIQCLTALDDHRFLFSCSPPPFRLSADQEGVAAILSFRNSPSPVDHHNESSLNQTALSRRVTEAQHSNLVIVSTPAQPTFTPKRAHFSQHLAEEGSPSSEDDTGSITPKQHYPKRSASFTNRVITSIRRLSSLTKTRKFSKEGESRSGSNNSSISVSKPLNHSSSGQDSFVSTLQSAMRPRRERRVEATDREVELQRRGTLFPTTADLVNLEASVSENEDLPREFYSDTRPSKANLVYRPQVKGAGEAITLFMKTASEQKKLKDLTSLDHTLPLASEKRCSFTDTKTSCGGSTMESRSVANYNLRGPTPNALVRPAVQLFVEREQLTCLERASFRVAAEIRAEVDIWAQEEMPKTPLVVAVIIDNGPLSSECFKTRAISCLASLVRCMIPEDRFGLWGIDEVIISLRKPDPMVAEMARTRLGQGQVTDANNPLQLALDNACAAILDLPQKVQCSHPPQSLIIIIPSSCRGRGDLDGLKVTGQIHLHFVSSGPVPVQAPTAHFPQGQWFVDLSNEGMKKQRELPRAESWLSRLLTAERFRLRPGYLSNVKIAAKKAGDSTSVSIVGSQAGISQSGDLQVRAKMMPGEVIIIVLMVVVDRMRIHPAATRSDAAHAAMELEKQMATYTRDLVEVSVKSHSSQFRVQGAGLELVVTETATVRRVDRRFGGQQSPYHGELLDNFTASAVASMHWGELAAMEIRTKVLAALRWGSERASRGFREAKTLADEIVKDLDSQIMAASRVDVPSLRQRSTVPEPSRM
jgi:hypothetical protein